MKKEEESSNEYAQHMYGIKTDFFLHLDDEFVTEEERERLLNMSDEQYDRYLKIHAEVEQERRRIRIRIFGE